MNKLLYCVRIMFVFLITTYSIHIYAQSYNSLLWKISIPESDKTSYLYGTMHSQDGRVHELGNLAISYLKKCDAVALELVGDTSKDIMGMMERLFMKDTVLQDLYSEEDYELLKKTITDKGKIFKSLFNLERIKPIYITFLISDIEEQNKQALIMDVYFQKIGREQQKQLIGIETASEQIATLDAIPLDIQAAMLLEQIENGVSHKQMLQEMVQLYLAQDLDSLIALYHQEYKNTDKDFLTIFNQEVLVKRNNKMSNRIVDIISGQSTFVAVGALHLPGKQGIINQLRQKGYHVEPCYMKAKFSPVPTKLPADVLAR